MTHYPKDVDIFLELNRHYYYRRHSYDHYQLFAVDSMEKSGLFKSNGQSPVIQNAVPASSIQKP